jgi:hypothetical protein
MKKANIRRATLVIALAAASTAWALNESKDIAADAPPQAAPVAVQEDATSAGLATNESVVQSSESVPVQTAPAPEPAPVPVIERAAPQPPVTVETRRLTLDERIQADVIDAVYNVPNISGKIGVESRDAVVTLTGYTTTGGMAWRAARAAGSVPGVRYVQNEIRQRVGPTI